MIPESLTTEAQPQANAMRTALFLSILVFLNLQGDGFRLATDPFRNQLLLVPFTLLFWGLLTALLLWRKHSPAALALLNSGRALLAIAAAALLPTAGLLLASVRHYALFRYHLATWPTVFVFLVAFTLLVGSLLRSNDSGRPNSVILSVLVASVALQLLCLRSFPLDIRRSDMLPLLAAAGRTLLAGLNPYHLYHFPTESVLLTYLPGTLLAYLPATWLHLDLRLTNLLCIAVMTLLIARSAAPSHRGQLAGLLAVWLMSPYVLYRHEIYTPPHWLILVASLLLLRHSRLVSSAIFFGLSISISQFSWILFPFVLLHVWQRSGSHRVRDTLRYATVALLAAAFIVLPFVLWSPHDFVFGVLSHWQQQGVSARPINLAFWIARIAGTRSLQPAQALVLVLILFVSAVRRSCLRFTGLLRTISLALASFILLNILVWGYFFLLLELMLLLFVASANGWLSRVDDDDTVTADSI